jgi:hypothetical protein
VQLEGVEKGVHPEGQKQGRQKVLMDSIEKQNQLVSFCFNHRWGNHQDDLTIARGYWDGDGDQSGVNYQGGYPWQ